MFTNCPECGTVFRISATDLRVAEGFVRCGNCSATFNALASLSDEPPSTVTLEQLVVRDEAPLPSGNLPADEPDVDTFADVLASVAVEVPNRPAADEQPERERTTGAGDALEFDVPEDNWPRFFEDTGVQMIPALKIQREQDADDGREVTPESGPGEWEGLLVDVREDDSEAAAEPVYVIGEEFPPAERSEVESSTVDQPDADGPPLADHGDDAGPPPVAAAAPGAHGQPDEFAAANNATHSDSAEPGPPRDWTPGAEADVSTEPGWAHQPMAWMPEPASHERRRTVGYALGSVLLVLLLAGQLVNHERDELAASRAWGKPFRTVYERLGLKLYPAWNLGAYDVRATEAVAGRTATGALDILARISITGTEPVGLPLVRVVLRDRWSNPIGSRVFTPEEYLGDHPHPAEPMAPGTLLPIRISLTDPGTEAYGYEVDVCLMTRTEGLQCQQEREPFRP